MDSVMKEMENRFTRHHETIIKLGFLIPEVVHKDNAGLMEESYKFYKHLIPNTTLEQAKGEFSVWEQTWNRIDKKIRPKDAISTLAKCDAVAFPVIHRLLTILSVQPVSTASAERSFSTLRRLKTWLRNRMGEERLTGLALMATHREKINNSDIPDIMEIFAMKKARRLNILM